MPSLSPTSSFIEMVLKRVMGMMMGCLGMSCCLRITDQPTRPAPPSECDDSTSASDDVEPKSSSSLTSSSASSVLASGRIKLSDGRYLAYKERGVPKNQSNYRIIIVHGFPSNKEMNLWLLRAGYGESDPFPKRSLKSEASDIQELADQLQLGSKFYIIGVSAGSCPTWSCVKDIPHRCHWWCKYNICEKTVKELLLMKIIYWLRERGAKLSYRFIVLSVLLPNLKRVSG